MNPGAQRHLARLLLRARGGPFWGGWVRWSVETYAEFMAALEAFQAIEAVTLAEANDFQNRMLAVLGHDPVPLEPKATGLPYVWLGEPSPFVESPDPKLIEVTEIEGPDVETPWGGRFGVRRIEHCDDRVVVHWSLDRWDDFRERLGGAMDDHARDTDGLPESVRAALRAEVQPYIGRSMNHFRLVDDIGTPYLPKHQEMGDGEGQSTYLPGVPASATRLFIEWYAWSTEIPFR